MNLHCKSFQHLNRKFIPCEYPKERKKKPQRFHSYITWIEILSSCLKTGVAQHCQVLCALPWRELHFCGTQIDPCFQGRSPAPGFRLWTGVSNHSHHPIYQEQPCRSSGINQIKRLFRRTRQWLWGPLTWSPKRKIYHSFYTAVASWLYQQCIGI